MPQKAKKFDYYEVLDSIINDGIAEISYIMDKPYDKHKLAGAIAGFNACRNREPLELVEIHKETNGYLREMIKGGRTNADEYWWFRYYRLEVEWVCDVISAFYSAYLNQGKKSLLPNTPTDRAMKKAYSIINK